GSVGQAYRCPRATLVLARIERVYRRVRQSPSLEKKHRKDSARLASQAATARLVFIDTLCGELGLSPTLRCCAAHFFCAARFSTAPFHKCLTPIPHRPRAPQIRTTGHLSRSDSIQHSSRP